MPFEALRELKAHTALAPIPYTGATLFGSGHTEEICEPNESHTHGHMSAASVCTFM